MAFASVGSFGTNNSITSTTTLTLTPTVTLEVGNLAVVIIATDNFGQGIPVNEFGHYHDGVISVTDTGSNVWTCIGNGSDVRAADGGAAVSVFASVITTQLTTGSTITATLDDLKTAKAITGWEYTIGSSIFSVEDMKKSYTQAADPASMTLDDLPSREYLLIRAIASETDSTAFTPTTNYTAFTNATADVGAAAVGQSANGEFRILTGTSDSSDPTKAAVDTASVYLALFEGTPTMPVVIGGHLYQQSTAGADAAWPRPHQINDIALFMAETAGGENLPMSVGAEFGFAEVTNSPQNTSETRLTVYWCRATSSSMSTGIFTDPGDHTVSKVFLIRGCITTGVPFDITVGSANDTPSTSVSITGGTTTVANTLVLAITTEGTDSTTDQFSSWANASLTRFRELDTQQTDLGHGGGFGIAVGRKATAGTVSATTCTLATSSDHAKLMIAFKPAPVSLPFSRTRPLAGIIVR